MFCVGACTKTAMRSHKKMQKRKKKCSEDAKVTERLTGKQVQ